MLAIKIMLLAFFVIYKVMLMGCPLLSRDGHMWYNLYHRLQIQKQMEFLDPAKKRSHTIRLFVGYVLVGIAIAIATIILLFQSYGYDIDRKTGEVIQNGLVFVDSKPIKAEVFVNGQSKGLADKRLTMPTGRYTLGLSSPGYRTWSRTFDLAGGSVEQLVYPLLFPDKLVTSEVAAYSGKPVFVSQSPDKRWLMVFQPGFVSGVDIYDLNSPTAKPIKASFAVGLFALSGKSHAVSGVEWSSDNRHVLIKHTVPGKSEYVILDRQDMKSSININKHLAVSPSRVVLRDKKHDRLYLHNNKTRILQSAEIATKRLSTVQKDVVYFKNYSSDTILYMISSSKSKDEFSLNIRSADKNYLVRTYTSKDTYAIDLSDYGGHNYAFVVSSAGQTYIYKDILEQAKAGPNVSPKPFLSFKQGKNPRASFSTSARFIAAQSGKSFAVYDAETDRSYYYDVKYKIGDNGAKWMDGHRLIAVSGNKTIVFDYDGINTQFLSPSVPEIPSFFNRDYTALYNIAPSSVSPKKFALSRTELVVK